MICHLVEDRVEDSVDVGATCGEKPIEMLPDNAGPPALRQKRLYGSSREFIDLRASQPPPASPFALGKVPGRC
jgi:hypothetical protein